MEITISNFNPFFCLELIEKTVLCLKFSFHKREKGIIWPNLNPAVHFVCKSLERSKGLGYNVDTIRDARRNTTFTTAQEGINSII